MKYAQVQFAPWDKAYSFSLGGLDVAAGDCVIVETELGLELGKVLALADQKETTGEERALKPIIRLASYDDIAVLISKIRELDLLVKLDTNGFFPEKLQRLIDLHLLDYIAMDIKYPEKEYPKRTEDKNSLDKVIKSIEIIMNSGVDYEFRTTYVKGIHKIKDSESIAKLIRGSKKYYIQNFRPGKTLNPTLSVSNSFNDNELNKILLGARKFVKNSQVR
mgnify:CR=1 FL=1